MKDQTKSVTKQRLIIKISKTSQSKKKALDLRAPQKFVCSFINSVMNFPFQYTCFWTPRLSESLFHSQKSFLFLSYRKIQWQKITETTQCCALCIKCQSRFFLKWHTRTLPGSASVHTHSSDIPLNVHAHTHTHAQTYTHTHTRARIQIDLQLLSHWRI